MRAVDRLHRTRFDFVFGIAAIFVDETLVPINMPVLYMYMLEHCHEELRAALEHAADQVLWSTHCTAVPFRRGTERTAVLRVIPSVRHGPMPVCASIGPTNIVVCFGPRVPHRTARILWRHWLCSSSILCQPWPCLQQKHANAALLTRSAQTRQCCAAAAVRLTAVCLLQRNRPMLFHCEHGKDRTGIIAALILLCARVSKEHIKKVMLLSAP